MTERKARKSNSVLWEVFRAVALVVGILLGVWIAWLTYQLVFGRSISVQPTSDPAINTLFENQKAQATAQADQAKVLVGIATQLAQPTAGQPVIPVATPAAQPTAGVQVAGSTQSGDWTLTWLAGADLDRGDGTTFRQDAVKWTWRKIAPELWPTFPNVPNPLVPEFRVVACADDPTKQCVPDGLEYANQESNFCQQLAGEACRVPVAAESYLYYSGDYNIPGVGSCSENGTGIGCMLVIVNVGRVTSDYTGVFSQGFRLHARYFNGNALDMAIWALTSEGANKMLNLNSKLNPQGIQNAGANCSVPEGCKGVHVQVQFTSGNEPLLNLTTTVNK